MTAPAAGLMRRYAAWSLDAALLSVVSLLATWPRVQAAAHGLMLAFRTLSAHLADRLGTAVVQGANPDALAAGMLADPAIRAATDAVQAALLGILGPPLLAYALLGLLYHVVGEGSRWQGSPGKHALGLTVARADGTRATPLQLVLRHLAGAVSWLTLNLGHALALVPPHRALHDLLSGTAVFGPSKTERLPAWAQAWLATQGVALVVVTAWALLRYLALLQAALAA